MLRSPLVRSAVLLSICAVVILPTFGATAPRVAVQGLTYSLSSVTGNRVTGSLANTRMPAPANTWKATVVYALGRGRVDITEGAQTTRFKQGDFILFDSTDFIIVDPTAKTFISGISGPYVPDSTSRARLSETRYSDISVRLDTIGVEDIGGHSARHFRLQYSYSLTFPPTSIGTRYATTATPSTSTVSQTLDEWFAIDIRLPPTPLLSLSPVPTEPDSLLRARYSDPSVDVTVRVRAVSAALPERSRLLKSRGTVQTSGASYTNIMEGAVEVSGIVSIAVDPARLVLPQGYTQVRGPDYGRPSTDPLPADGGAKWRVKPPGF